MSQVLQRFARVLCGALLLITAVPVGAPARGTPAEPCSLSGSAQPFLPWNDHFSYVLLPGGELEASTHRRWTLTGDARLVPGNEPFKVHDAKDSKSLRLAGGAAATSPPTCVANEWPTLRFFVRQNFGPATATLMVEVLYVDALGTLRELQIGAVPATQDWEPTPISPVVVNSPFLRAGGSDVAFRFSPQAGSTWQIDDVYIDPWRAR